MPGEFLVTALVKRKLTSIPSSQDVLEKGDKIMGVVKISSLAKIKKLFSL